MTVEAEVILATQFQGKVLTTVRLRYWRAIHAEVMTHRVLSRNAGSSRAIPVKKVLAQVWNDPAGPTHWGKNQAGMQAEGELWGWRRKAAGTLWRTAGKVACIFAWGVMKLGLHKQVANRLLEPWQYINVIVTATDWGNFFDLRLHPDAQPETQELAQEILKAQLDVSPTPLKLGEWHIPYISASERNLPLKAQLALSVARVARVSYTPFNGKADVQAELERHDKLRDACPMHASPFEHQAKAVPGRHANFSNYRQYRWYVENSESLNSARQ